jgi:hypothetical protein
MASTAEVHLVGGPADGTVVTVELDVHGRPPLTHHHLGHGGLAEAQIYELESEPSRTAPPWRYAWRGEAT